MKFSDFLNEADGKGITFVDIDETLFFTNALIYVLKDDKIIKKLTNTEFNTYVLKDDERFDFREFKDSEIFKNSKPNMKMIDKINAIFNNIKKSGKGSEMHLLTARGDFNDKETFLDILRSYGIDVGHRSDGKIHVLRAGNIKGTSAETKKVIIKRFLDENEYKRVRLYDDADSNIKMFLQLSEEYPDISFEAYKINHYEIKRVKNEI